MKTDLIKQLPLVALVLLFQIPLGSYAQELHLSISELFALTSKNSERIKLAQWSIEQSKEKIGLAKSARLPDIETDISYSYLSDITIWDPHFNNREIAAMPHNGMKFGLEATQIIFAGGRINKNIEKESLASQVAYLNLEKDEADVKLLLVGKYLDLYKLIKQKVVFEQNIKLSLLRLKNIESLNAEGMVTHNDITRSQLQLSRLELNLEEVDNSIEIINHELCVTLGLAEHTQIYPEEIDERLIQSERSYDDWISEAVSKLPENKISAIQLQLAQNELDLVKAQRLPVLNFFADNHLQRPLTIVVPAQDIFLNEYQIGLKLKYDISSLYHVKEKISLAKHGISYSETAVKLQLQEIDQRVHHAFIKYKEAISKMDTYRKNVELAQENYEQIEVKYFNQLALLVDMIDASNEKLNAELQLQNGQAERIFNFYKLERTTGNL